MIYFYALAVAAVVYVFFKPIYYKGEVKIRNATQPIYETNTFFSINFPVLYGWRLKLAAYLINTTFGKLILMSSSINEGGAELRKFRRQICSYRPTLFPVKVPLPGSCQLASGNKIVDEPSLAHKFPPGWRPIIVDDYINAYKNKLTTPVHIADDIIAKIKLMNHEMRIFCDWDEKLIRDAATQSKDRHDSNTLLGPYDGVPIVVKDQFATIGLTRRWGYDTPQHQPSETDAVVVERIRAQGMIIIGLTNMHQGGLCCSGINPSKLHGTTRNPVDPAYHAGGSSNGTAAAISIGLVPFGIGTDGGGSVRIPACLTNTAAIKASCGRIPNRGYGHGSNGNIGPMANTMIDCMRLYSIIAGPDFTNESIVSWYQPVVEVPKQILKPLNGLKVGIDYDWVKQANDDIAKVFRQNVRKLVSEGAELVQISIADILNTDTAHFITFVTECSMMATEFLEHNEHMNPETSILLYTGQEQFRALDYTLALQFRTKLMEQMELLFKKIDVLVTPTTAGSASKVLPEHERYGRSDARETSRLAKFTKICNFTGLPAITTPMGYDDNNMPIGIQFVANWWNELKLFEIGVYFEEFVQRRKPKYYLSNELL